MNKYLYISPNIEILKYTIGEEPHIVFQSQEQSLENRTTGGKTYKLNESSLEILKQFNGEKTYEDIISYFQDKYIESYEIVEHNIQIFLNIIKSFGFNIKEQESPIIHEIGYYEYDNIYPTVVSLELTDKCNIRCRHCYGFFGSENSNSIPPHKLETIIESFREIGVLTVELTGGDPSVYPYTAEAIDIAIEKGIQSITLLTNGIHLSEKLIDTIVRHKSRIFVQIDLHSLNEDYYDWFTNSKNNLDKVKNNIDILTSKDVQVRVCSIVTPLNYKEIIDIADWAYAHKAKLYATSPVVQIGRANDKKYESKLLFNEMDELEEYLYLHEKIIKKYPGFIRISDGEEARKNKMHCGIITSQCSISADGELKFCTMDTGKYFDFHMGNIFKNTLKEIYDQNTELLNTFLKLSMPKRDSDLCKSCDDSLFCDSCFLRGFLRAMDNNGNCLWYQQIPKIVRDKFPLISQEVGVVQSE